MSNQLQGIMECSDILNLACLLEMKTFYRVQKQRLNALIGFQQKTNCIMIGKYHKVDAIPASFPRIFEYPIAKPETGDLVKEVLTKAISSWIKWCESAIKLYESAEGAYWKRLLMIHKRDLICAQHWMKHFGITSLPSNSVKERLQQKLNTTKE